MPANAKTKRTSVQTYRHSARLVIRLEYDQADERQSVFLNSELRSSFHCPAGFRAEHSFRGTDPVAEERGHESEWRIIFAVEEKTFRIRHDISRRNDSGEDLKWYWWDRNTEPDEWMRFPEFDDGEQIEVECDSCGTTKQCPECEPPATVNCEKCSTELICPKCEPPAQSDICVECGGTRTCECNQEEMPRLVHDVARMQEELEQIGAERLCSTIIEIVGNQADSSTSWATVIEQVLEEVGCDLSAVRLSLNGQDSDAD
ncbi:MAG: hypothetical protein SF069_17965 [Phycisphaerae bacterium]|nr:hypothetical protein [Phycisphaerae bacterium]